MILALARDLGSLGIRVVTIAPGLAETPLPAGLPDDVRDGPSATGRFHSGSVSPPNSQSRRPDIFQSYA